MSLFDPKGNRSGIGLTEPDAHLIVTLLNDLILRGLDTGVYTLGEDDTAVVDLATTLRVLQAASMPTDKETL